jgi:cell division protein FtsN
MKPSEDELISHIKKTLASHEEPYLPGAWEKFNESPAKERKRLFGFYQFLNVAAMLLVGVVIFLYVDKAVKKPAVEVVKNKIAKPNLPEQNAPLSKEEENSIEANIKVPDDLPASSFYASAGKYAKSAAKQRQYLAQAENRIKAETPENDLNPVLAFSRRSTINTETLDGPDNNSSSQPAVVPKPDDKVSTFQRFLEKEQLAKNEKEEVRTTKEKQDKWAMGLLVAPSLGNNNKLNMGYGLSMDYALSKKISLTSGISYNDMKSSSQVQAPDKTASFVSSSSKNLESVEASVSGIDVPLGIKYNLSKKIYANVGISAFAVLNQRQNNTYLQETSVQASSTEPATFGEMRILIVNERITEQAPEAPVGNKYIGFYNFSFGIRQPLSKKNTLSLEPFIKLPMKEATQDNLKLIGTGIKLKLDF